MPACHLQRPKNIGDRKLKMGELCWTQKMKLARHHLHRKTSQHQVPQTIYWINTLQTNPTSPLLLLQRLSCCQDNEMSTSTIWCECSAPEFGAGRSPCQCKLAMFVKAGDAHLCFAFCTQDREVCACWVIPMCFCISQVCHEGLQPASLPQPPTSNTPTVKCIWREKKILYLLGIDLSRSQVSYHEAHAPWWQKSWCWLDHDDKWVTSSRSTLYNQKSTSD